MVAASPKQSRDFPHSKCTVQSTRKSKNQSDGYYKEFEDTIKLCRGHSQMPRVGKTEIHEIP